MASFSQHSQQYTLDDLVRKRVDARSPQTFQAPRRQENKGEGVFSSDTCLALGRAAREEKYIRQSWPSTELSFQMMRSRASSQLTCSIYRVPYKLIMYVPRVSRVKLYKYDSSECTGASQMAITMLRLSMMYFSKALSYSIRGLRKRD